MDPEHSFDINTGWIYSHEFQNWNSNSDNKLRGLIYEMETVILNLLERNEEFTFSADHNSHTEYFIEKQSEFEHNHLKASDKNNSPFTHIFLRKKYKNDDPTIMSSSDYTREEIIDAMFKDRPEGFNWYLYDYHHSITVKKDLEDPDIFNFFYAFALRQVDYMQIDNFLNYHMKESFNNDKRIYFRFLTLILRKYQVLYDENRLLTIDEWMEKGYWSTEDQISAIKDSDKINWLGTQKNLAELFIELKEKSWIEEIDPDKVKKSFTKSNSIEQLFILSYDRDEKKHVFDKVYTESYRPKFHNIYSPKRRKNN